jgi:hypothetical protein
MSVEKAEGLQVREEPVPPFRMKITSYKIGDAYHCVVDNVDPGAIIARSEGSTRTEAEGKAVTRARERLEHSIASLRFRQE